MRCRYYHLPLDLAPTWGPIIGLGIARELAWVQAAEWWQMMLVMAPGILTVNGEPVPFPEGSLLVVPPLSKCRMARVEDVDRAQFWAKFQPQKSGTHKVAVPQVKALGPDAECFERQFRQGLDYSIYSRKHLEVLGWNLLWTVGENAAVISEDPVLAQVEKEIQQGLSGPLSPETLAASAGVSVRQLGRLFAEQHAQSPTDFIRSQRMTLACRLLMKSDRSIKEVAIAVGIPDLHRFNKVVRETFGCSPRALKADAGEPSAFSDPDPADHEKKELHRALKMPVAPSNGRPKS